MVDYRIYIDYVEKICKDDDLSNFKCNENYKWVLEHVDKDTGASYIKYINKLSNISFNEIQGYCLMNDIIGNPDKSDYYFITTSPTNMRYILHSHIILTYLKSLNLPSIDIVEVGGGYGGLCLAINYFCEKYNIQINSYTIIDLPAVSTLQKKYISLVNPKLSINYLDSTTFGSTLETNNMFLISNYCFSEIADDLQKQYIQHLFPKVSHGFMAWNIIPLYNFGFEYKHEELKLTSTSKYNLDLYVYF
jgi:hypothetical protein